MLRRPGPMLLACNHPNSFLDAIILATLFRHPIYSLARGDAFASKNITRILNAFNMLPVYRVSEGVENLEHNYATFDACQQIFRKNGIVLIFSEGRCINEWHLRPLKKGTARLALTAWENGIALKVLPVGINYSSFKKFGKNVILRFGNFIKSDDISKEGITGRSIASFNVELNQQLNNLVIELPKDALRQRQLIFKTTVSRFKFLLLALPAFVGFLLHVPLLSLFHLIIRKKAKDHYDSIVVGLLFFFYPVYLLILAIVIALCCNWWMALLIVLIVPLTLWSFLQVKKIT